MPALCTLDALILVLEDMALDIVGVLGPVDWAIEISVLLSHGLYETGYSIYKILDNINSVPIQTSECKKAKEYCTQLLTNMLKAITKLLKQMKSLRFKILQSF